MRSAFILLIMTILFQGVSHGGPQQRKPKAGGDPTLSVQGKGKKIQKQMKKKKSNKNKPRHKNN